MKKSNFLIVLLGFFSVIGLFAPFIFQSTIFNPMFSMNTLTLYITIFLGLFLLIMYFKFEEASLNAKDISLIAIYSTFTAVARVPFVVLPSVQPCSYLIFCVGYVFGPLTGFIVGGNTALISNLILGQGPWTIYQMIAWGLIGIFGGLMNFKKDKILNRTIMALIGFVWGFLYGWITNLWSWFLMPVLSWESFLLVNLNSFIFDLSHAIANFIFLYYFGSQTINILNRYKHRFTIIMDPSPVLSPSSIEHQS